MAREVLHILNGACFDAPSIVGIVGELAQRLDPERYRIHAWLLEGYGPLAEDLRAEGIEVKFFNWTRGARDPAGAWRFWRALREERDRFAIIHEHTLGRPLRLLVRAATPAKLASHLHVIWYKERGNHYRLVRKFNFGAHCVICTSRAAADTVRGARPRVVYPGIPIPPACHPKGERVSRPQVIGTAGRLAPVKGITFLLRAFRLLRAEFPEVRLEIAGEGPLREELQAEASALGLQDRVAFLGWRKDLLAVLQGWDIYVQPSLLEAFGVAALEAMATGLPLVGTAAGGLPELIADGKTGLLVPPRDPEALAEAIRRLLLNPAQARDMGVAGRERAVKYFSVERMVAQIAEIYDDLLNPPSGRAPLKTRAQLSAGAPS